MDITQYGARSTETFDPITKPGTAAVMASGSNAVLLSVASKFRNGDGVTIFGAGSPHAMPTPGAPTVVPSVAGASTGTGIVVKAPSGALSYFYQIIARNAAGGLTAASPAGTTVAGSVLGSQNVAIKSLSRVGVKVTVETVAPHGLSPRSMVIISATSDRIYFDGWFAVATVPDNLHFTVITGQDSNSGASTSATGGKATWFNCNHLTWKAVPGAFVYYVYGRTPESCVLLGVSLPTTTWWDDFGSPMVDKFLAPYYVPLMPPEAATSNNLTTTISTGAGTLNLILANPAGTPVNGAPILFDNAPAIAAAVHDSRFAAGGMVYIPPGRFIVNSYLLISGPLGLSCAGSLYLNDTVEMTSGVRFSGLLSLQGYGAPSFGFEGLSAVEVNRANPGLWSAAGTGPVRGISFRGIAENNTRLVVYGGMNQQTFESVVWSTGVGGTDTDFMGVGLTVLQNSDVMFNSFKNIVLLGGPGNTGFNGTTATPAMMFPQGTGNMTVDGISMSARGIFMILNPAGPHSVFKFGRIQGGLEPFITLWNSQYLHGCTGGSIDIQEIESDTTGMPMVANLGECLQYVTVMFRGCNGPSNGLGLMSGPAMKLYTESGGWPWGQNVKVIAPDTGYFSDNSVQVDGLMGCMGYRMPAPDAPVSAVASAGGAVPVGLMDYAVSATDAFGRCSFLGKPIRVEVTPGNQMVTVMPPVKTPPGAVALYYWRRLNNGYFGVTGTGSGVRGPYPLTKPFIDKFGFKVADDPADLGLALSAGLSAKGMETHTLMLSPSLVADLPAAAPGNSGWMRLVTDWGTTPAPALVFSDGIAWKCVL